MKQQLKEKIGVCKKTKTNQEKYERYELFQRDDAIKRAYNHVSHQQGPCIANHICITK